MRLKVTSFKDLENWLYMKIVVPVRGDYSYEVDSPLSTDSEGSCFIDISRRSILRTDRRPRDFEREEASKMAPYQVSLYTDVTDYPLAEYDPRDHSVTLQGAKLRERCKNSNLLLERLEYMFKSNPPFNKIKEEKV